MMLKAYPDRVLSATPRVLADVLAILWTLLWAFIGWLVYETVLSLQVISDGIGSTGRTFNDWAAAFKKAVPSGIPFVTDALQGLADGVRKYSGDPLIAAGHQVHDAIFQVAVVLGIFTALPPILFVLLVYGIWRWRDMREMGAALAFVRIAAVTGRAEQARAVLAYRAVSTLTFRQLMSASSDPVGDLAEHRYERLSSAMLRRAGLDPTRLPQPGPPLLRGHRRRTHTEAE